MRTYRIESRKVPDSIICDVCGKNCTNDNFGTECAYLDACWGYNSKKDGTKYDLHLCETCFDFILNCMKIRRGSLGYYPQVDPL